MTAIPQVLAARQYPWQLTHYLRFTVNFNDPLVSAPRDPRGCLPTNAFLTSVQTEVVTAFNAATTNVLTVGTTTANANEIVSAADVTEGTPGIYASTGGIGRSLTASGPTNVYAKYTQTGTAATTGKAIITIQYIPDNDG